MSFFVPSKLHLIVQRHLSKSQVIKVGSPIYVESSVPWLEISCGYFYDVHSCNFTCKVNCKSINELRYQWVWSCGLIWDQQPSQSRKESILNYLLIELYIQKWEPNFLANLKRVKCWHQYQQELGIKNFTGSLFGMSICKVFHSFHLYSNNQNVFKHVQTCN